MLPRVLEPEVMDSDEEARDYDAMDHAEVNRVFVADFLSHYSGNGPVLDVGTGTAQIPLELCRRHLTMRVHAVDAAHSMLKLARENVERAGLADRIQLSATDAKGLPFPSGGFAALISNSIAHHIPEPRTVLAEMARVTAAQGVFFVRDLLRPDDDAAVRRLVDRYTPGANEHQRAMFDASLRAALTLEEIRSLVRELGFAEDTVQPTSDRHWTWAVKK